MALGAAEADRTRFRVFVFVSVFRKLRSDALGALAGAGADEGRDLPAVEPRPSLFELAQESERREAPVDAGEAEVVRGDGLEGGSVLGSFFFSPKKSSDEVESENVDRIKRNIGFKTSSSSPLPPAFSLTFANPATNLTCLSANRGTLVEEGEALSGTE